MHEINAVDSTLLRSIAYDDNRELLQIEFHNGAVYQFFDVPANIHEAFYASNLQRAAI